MLLMGTGPEKYVTTDEHGSFDERDLDPGTWSLSTWPDETELEALGEAKKRTFNGMTHIAQQTVDLERGAEVEVALGAPPLSGVHVRGRILIGGVAREGYMTWMPDGRD